jgi:hypothetical protein
MFFAASGLLVGVFVTVETPLLTNVATSTDAGLSCALTEPEPLVHPVSTNEDINNRQSKAFFTPIQTTAFISNPMVFK